MVDWNRKFRSEYDAARDVLASARRSSRLAALVAQLARLMGLDGFDVARAECSTSCAAAPRMRPMSSAWTRPTACSRGRRRRRRRARRRRRRAAAPPPSSCCATSTWRAAAGSRGVWIVALPVGVHRLAQQPVRRRGRQPRRRASAAGRTPRALRRAQRRWLGVATQQGLAWCQRAAMVLADARRARGARARTRVTRARSCDAGSWSRGRRGRSTRRRPRCARLQGHRRRAQPRPLRHHRLGAAARRQHGPGGRVPAHRGLRVPLAQRGHGRRLRRGRVLRRPRRQRAARPGQLDAHPRARALAPGLRHARRQ